MNFNIDELKKKIIYRSLYRGTKEMDNLMGSFTKKIINNLNQQELINLSNLLIYFFVKELKSLSISFVPR